MLTWTLRDTLTHSGVKEVTLIKNSLLLLCTHKGENERWGERERKRKKERKKERLTDLEKKRGANL